LYNSDNDSDQYSSSEDDQSSSSEDFPSPGSPRRRQSSYKKQPEDYGQLYNKVRDLQRQLFELDLRQRKMSKR
jgi:hypothetical protein